MNKELLEQIIVKCVEEPNNNNLKQLHQILVDNSTEIKDVNENLNLFFESLDENELDITIANFLISIASLNIENTPKIRLLLTASIKLILPPYLNKQPIIKALGLRDGNIPPSNMIGRFKKLNVLKNGQIIFLNNTSRFGTVNNIDNITGTVTINQFGGGTVTTPLEVVLISGLLFASCIDMLKISDNSGNTKMSCVDFKKILESKTLLSLTQDHLMQIAKAGVAAKMTPEQFESWWNDNSASSTNSNATRRACDGRTIQEILVISNKEEPEALTDDEVDKYATFFTNLKSDVIKRDLKSLALVMVAISSRANDDQKYTIFSHLHNKVPFLPADPLRSNYDDIAVWSELPAKDVALLAKITLAILGEDYIAGLAMVLPLKGVTAIAPLVSPDYLDEMIVEQHFCSADLSLWIWKNRKKGSESLLKHLKMDNIIRALSQANLPKAWTASYRELKNLLIDNAEFHKFLISMSADPLKLTNGLQGALFLSSGERQSLMVKLARSSKELQSHLEQGAGQKILKAGMSKKEQQAQDDMNNEPSYTSHKSHRALLKELDDIIKIHKPENREALKIARAHGDFRENAEFDAAKERRNFLSRRQGELERDLLDIQPMDFSDIQIGKVAVIGSKVTLTFEDNSTEVHYLLGAWDGNPEKNYLSYKTRLGQLIYHKEIGEKFELPNKKIATLSAIEPLPKEVLKDME